MSEARRSSWKREALRQLAIATVTLVVFELAIRIYDSTKGRGFSSAHRNLVHRDVGLRPFRSFGPDYYEEHDGERYISSRHGELYALDKPPGAIRIVVFGGSTSENLHGFVEAGIHYPLLIQRRLRAALGRDDLEVINVANSSYSTAHSLIALELDVLSWDPDLIIISHNFNDLFASYFPGFTSDYSHLYSDDFFTPDFSIYTVPNLLLQHSSLYWFVKSNLEKLFTEPPPLQRRSLGDTPDPRATRVFERNLRSMILLAQAQGIDAVLGNQALERTEEFFLVHAAPQPTNAKAVYPLHNEFLAHHRLYNTLLEEVAADTGSLFVDNDAALGGRREYFFDFVHHTIAGVEKLAGSYTDALLSSGVLNRQSVAGETE